MFVVHGNTIWGLLILAVEFRGNAGGRQTIITAIRFSAQLTAYRNLGWQSHDTDPNLVFYEMIDRLMNISGIWWEQSSIYDDHFSGTVRRGVAKKNTNSTLSNPVSSYKKTKSYEKNRNREIWQQRSPRHLQRIL